MKNDRCRGACLSKIAHIRGRLGGLQIGAKPARVLAIGAGVAMRASPGDNLAVEKSLPRDGRAAPSETHDLFPSGTLVVVNLCNPREKFWGMILALAPAGISLSGVDLASFENIAAMAREGEPFIPSVVFFPMHRIERILLDVHDGSLSSLSHRFFAKTGLQPSAALAPSSVHRPGNEHTHDLRPHASKERA